MPNNYASKSSLIIFILFIFSVFLLPFILSSLFLIPISFSLLFSYFLFIMFASFTWNSLEFPSLLKSFKLILLILFHGFISFTTSFYNQPFNLQKFSLSLIYLFLILIFSDLSCQIMKKYYSSYSLQVTFNFFSYFLLIAAYFSVFGFLFIHNGGKPIFFYSEPSHFVIAFIPFLIYKISTSSKYELIFFCASTFYLTLLMPSATLLAALLIFPILIKKFRQSFFIYISFIFIFFTFIFINSHLLNSYNGLTSSKLNSIHANHNSIINNVTIFENPSASIDPSFSPNDHFSKLTPLLAEKLKYFVDRLPISRMPSSNLSLNVYMSGWSRALLNVINTYGFGIGFQQLGYVGAIDKYLNFISLNNSPFGFNDGGCVAAKLISEFGIFGLIAIAVYLIYLFKSLKKIRLTVNGNNKIFLINLDFLYDIFYISFLIPLFFRSFGYFTPLFFILCMSIFYKIVRNNTINKDDI